MEFDTTTRKYITDETDRQLPELKDVESVSEEDAFDVMLACASRAAGITDELAGLSAKDFTGSRRMGQYNQLTRELSVLDGVINCIGARISLDSSIQEVQEFANRRTQD